MGGATPRPSGFSNRTPTAVALAAAVLFLLAVVSPAAGHEGGPRLILEPAQVAPGGVVLIRGEDLPLDETMRVSLAGDAGRADLGQVTTDGEGHFNLAAPMPIDAPLGTYRIEAVNTSGTAVRSLIVLRGTPILEQGGAPPGQDEGFPAPGTTVTPTTAPPAAAVTTAAPVASAGSGLRPLSDPNGTAGDPVPFIALAGAIGALGFLVWRTRRTPATQAGSAELP
jgi:hypothetical protein